MSSRSRSSARGRRGFTLIEVLIVIGILAAISLAIYQATTSTFAIRATLNDDSEFYDAIRVSLAIMEKDIVNTYSPRSMLPEEDAPAAPATNPDGTPAPEPTPTPTPTEKAGEKPADGAPEYKPPTVDDLKVLTRGESDRPTRFWGAVIHGSGLRPSRLQGEEAKLDFVSAGNARVYRGSPESVFVKVSYFLEPDPDASGKSVLYRVTDTNAFGLEDDDKDSKTRRRYKLMSGITAFKLKYFQKEKNTWHTRWDTTHSDFKGAFPDVIELEIQVSQTERLNFEGKQWFRPDAPLAGLPSSY